MRTPNFEQILHVLKNEEPSRPTLFEFYMNDILYCKLAGRAAPNINNSLARSKWIIDAYKNAGYDYATLKVSNLFYFPKQKRKPGKSVSLNEGCMIKDWDSFENYDWPEPDEIDFGYLKELEAHIPNSMKIIVPCAGPQENLIDIVGFNNLCYMLFEKPELVKATIDNIGDKLVKLYQRILEYPVVGGVVCSDDWGHKTQTMFSPEIMARYIFPWHKRIVDLAHNSDRPIILHSCGNLSKVMNNIIEIGYDAKHSYEDGILPVEEAYETYGERIAILGGIDVDFLCREPVESIKTRCIGMLDRCTGKGGYALGSGNSIPDFMPDEKFFAMISTVTNSK